MTEKEPVRPVLLDDHEPTSASDPEEDEPKRPEGLHLRNVYLRQPDPADQGRRLGWLARRLGLEHYSAKLLTRKVNVVLSVLAALLLAIFAYEFAAWSFFFNGIFVGDIGRFNGAGTMAALALALLFAGVILFFEWQVITADTLRLTEKQKKLAQRVRVVSILGAGFIIAHTVDLLAFNKPIAKRIHREAVHAEALQLAEDIKGLIVGLEEGRKRLGNGDLAALRDNIEATRQRRDQAAAGLESYRKQEGYLRNEARAAKRLAEEALARAEGSVGDTRERRAQRALEAAQRRYDETSSELRETIGNQGAAAAIVQSENRRLEELATEEKRLLEERATLKNRTERLGGTIEKLKGRLRSWIAELERLEPGDHIEVWSGWKSIPEEEKSLWLEHWRQPLKFEEPEKNFFERIDTLYGLAFGNAWKWLNGSVEKRAEIPSYLPSAGLKEQEPWITYFLAFLGIHLAAIFVPFLVFAVKWYLMPKEVDAYFSTWHQAFAGDLEARLILSVEEKVRGKDEHW